jgi:thioredoxin 1
MKSLLRFRTLSILLVLTMTVFPFCKAQSEYQVEPARFKAKVESNLAAVTLLDVRTPVEYDRGHVAGAVLMDYNGGQFAAEMGKIDKNKPVFVYCQSGGRSSSAADELRKAGHREVYELKGGILAWRNSGLPTETAVPAAVATPAVPGAVAATTPDGSKEMTREEFTALLTSAPIVLIDFYAPWCGPCKQMEPMLNELNTTYSGKLKVIRIDVDQNPSLAREFNISGIPYFMMYKGADLLMEHKGTLTRDAIIKQAGI